MLFIYSPELSTNVGETTVVSGVLVRNDILILDCFPADNWKAQAARTRNRLSRKFPRSSVICTEEIANLWYEPLSVSISERDGFPPGRFLAYQQCQLIYITVLNIFKSFKGQFQRYDHALGSQISEASWRHVLNILRHHYTACDVLVHPAVINNPVIPHNPAISWSSCNVLTHFALSL